MRLNATGIKAPNKFPIHNIGKILSKHGPVLVHLPQSGTSGSDTNMKSIVAIKNFLDNDVLVAFTTFRGEAEVLQRVATWITVDHCKESSHAFDKCSHGP
jgi:hypothetical protein